MATKKLISSLTRMIKEVNVTREELETHVSHLNFLQNKFEELPAWVVSFAHDIEKDKERLASYEALLTKPLFDYAHNYWTKTFSNKKAQQVYDLMKKIERDEEWLESQKIYLAEKESHLLHAQEEINRAQAEALTAWNNLVMALEVNSGEEVNSFEDAEKVFLALSNAVEAKKKVKKVVEETEEEEEIYLDLPLGEVLASVWTEALKKAGVKQGDTVMLEGIILDGYFLYEVLKTFEEDCVTISIINPIHYLSVSACEYLGESRIKGLGEPLKGRRLIERGLLSH